VKKMGMLFKKIDAHLDKAMSGYIEEWELATHRDMGDLDSRLAEINTDVDELVDYSAKANERIDNLEKRVKILKKGGK